MKYTLGEAAKVTGKSKSAIFRALKKGQISYEMREGNKYQIDASELFRVFPKNDSGNDWNVSRNDVERSGTDVERLDLLVKIAELQARCDAAERRCDVADRRAEEWKQQAEMWQKESSHWREKVTALLEYQPKEKKRWWSR